MNSTARLGHCLFAAALLLTCAACDQKSSPPASTPATAADASSNNAAPEYLAIHAALPKEVLDAEGGKGSGLAPTLTQHAASFQRLLDATKRGECDFAVDRSPGLDTVLPHLGKMRGLARALRADAERALAAGELDPAAQRVAAMIRLGRHITLHGESMIEWLVGSAVASMGANFVKDHPELAKAAWKTDIQQAISEATPGDPLGVKRSLNADRIITVRSLREGKIPDMSSMGGRNWKQVPQAERDQIAPVLDQLWQRALDSWDAPDAQTKLAAIMQEAEASPAKGLISAIDKMHKSAQTLQADLNAANAALR